MDGKGREGTYIFFSRRLGAVEGQGIWHGGQLPPPLLPPRWRRPLISLRGVQSVLGQDNHHTVVFPPQKAPTAEWAQAQARLGANFIFVGARNRQAHAGCITQSCVLLYEPKLAVRSARNCKIGLSLKLPDYCTATNYRVLSSFRVLFLSLL